jgi:TonB family protein
MKLLTGQARLMIFDDCRRVVLIGVAALACSAPSSGGSRSPGAARPDEPPVMVNTEAPFHYPASLYARKLQGNVTLRLFIDVNGAAVPDSTRVDETSGYPEFDSAAVAGARQLRFVPAKLRGEPMAMTILFPVYFRHPEVPALPGDSILRKGR